MYGLSDHLQISWQAKELQKIKVVPNTLIMSNGVSVQRDTNGTLVKKLMNAENQRYLFMVFFKIIYYIYKYIYCIIYYYNVDK